MASLSRKEGEWFPFLLFEQLASLISIGWAKWMLIPCQALASQLRQSLFYFYLRSVAVDSSWPLLLLSQEAIAQTRGELSKGHLEPIASRQWKVVLAWIAFHPDELLFVDKNEQTALHHACLFRAPTLVVQMMLFQAPELAGMKNRDGEVALHWAVRLSAPTEVLKLLLRASPSSGITARDKDGNTPLSLLWERHQESVLRAWWQGGRDTLIHLPCWKRILLLLQYYESEQSNSNNCKKVSEDNEMGEPIIDLDSFQALHVAAKVPCPSAFFPLVMHAYKNQLSVRDQHGRLPLAAASLDPMANRSSGVRTKIHLLLSEYAQAIHVADISGRTPFFIALGAGVAWEEGVEQYFALDPKLLLQRDPVTGLFPGMLAATAVTRRCTCMVEPAVANQAILDADPPNEWLIEERRSLSTIFNLLRACPEQIQRGRSIEYI